MLVHIFGKVDSPCCPNRALRKNYPQESTRYQTCNRKELLLGRYFKTFIQHWWIDRIIATLVPHRFCLTKSEILYIFPKTGISSSFDLHNPTAERAIAIFWNINQDKLTFKSIAKDYHNTRCYVLSLVSWVFDPLGVLKPSLLEPKLIIQELWKLKISWDEQIPKKLEARWVILKNEMINISHINLDR